jgi:precorrin-3B synthase
VVTALDEALCARPALAELSGRFLFTLDDGRGDLAGIQADVAVRAVDHREALLTLGTRAVRIPWSAAVDLMLASAEAFLAEHTQEWRIAELEDGEDRILNRLDLQATEELPTASTTIDAGWHENALVVTVPLGSLTQEQAAAITHAVTGTVRLTPWRSVVLPGVSAERLRDVGLVTTPDSPWDGVTACAGRPGCAKALADVRADARSIMPGMPRDGRRVHWSGCERRCGKPAGEFVDVVAVGNGYLVDGVRM